VLRMSRRTVQRDSHDTAIKSPGQSLKPNA
jgi:hypothetical protein